MTWIQTRYGKEWKLLDPDPADVCLQDIAASLNWLCRFNGHCSRFYSVADHSVLVARELESVHGPRLALHGLLHDAAEAYMGDMASPLKRLFPEFKKMEEKTLRVIYEGLGVEYPSDADLKIVKAYDLRALVTEQALFMPDPPKPWGWEMDHRPFIVYDQEDMFLGGLFESEFHRLKGEMDG